MPTTRSKTRTRTALAAGAVAAAALTAVPTAAHAVAASSVTPAAKCYSSQDGTSQACSDVFYLYPNTFAYFHPLANDQVPAGTTATYCGNHDDGRTHVEWQDDVPVAVTLSRYAKPGSSVLMGEYTTWGGDCSDNDAVASADIIINVLTPIKPTVTVLKHDGGIRVTNRNAAGVGCWLYHSRTDDYYVNGKYDPALLFSVPAHGSRTIHSAKDAGHTRRFECVLGTTLIYRLVHLAE